MEAGGRIEEEQRHVQPRPEAKSTFMLSVGHQSINGRPHEDHLTALADTVGDLVYFTFNQTSPINPTHSLTVTWGGFLDYDNQIWCKEQLCKSFLKRQGSAPWNRAAPRLTYWATPRNDKESNCISKSQALRTYYGSVAIVNSGRRKKKKSILDEGCSAYGA